MILPFMCKCLLCCFDRSPRFLFYVHTVMLSDNSDICKSLFGQKSAFDALAGCLPVCCWYVQNCSFVISAPLFVFCPYHAGRGTFRRITFKTSYKVRKLSIIRLFTVQLSRYNPTGYEKKDGGNLPSSFSGNSKLQSKTKRRATEKENAEILQRFQRFSLFGRSVIIGFRKTQIYQRFAGGQQEVFILN